MSLEVDQRGHEAPIPEQAQKEPCRIIYEKNNVGGGVYPVYDNMSAPPASPSKEQPRRRPMVLWLGIALAIMTVLAIVAAAVGGSTAVKRKDDNNRLAAQFDTAHLALQQCLADNNDTKPTALNSTANATANSPPQQPTALPHPTSNCTAMSSTYVTALNNSPFTIHCKIDYPGADILGIWMFTFADCIEACGSWNFHQNSPSCYAVTFDSGDVFTEESGIGNCFLKGRGDVQARAKNVTDSAQASFSGSD